MSILLSASQMRRLEDAAISGGQVTGLELMERAGQSVVAAILDTWPELRPAAPRASICAGPGNNGGDGFVVARLLHDLGWQVTVWLYGQADRMPPDARRNHDRWLELGELRPAAGFDPAGTAGSVLIDAVLGTGLSRPVTGGLADFLGQIAQAAKYETAKSVAIDLPSGLCADSGRLIGEAASTALTVTFGHFKSGHFLAEGPEKCGRLLCCDIGLDPKAPRRLFRRSYDTPEGPRYDYSPLASLYDAESLEPGFSDPKGRLDKGWLGHEAHKFSHGHAFLLSGPPGRCGAARLAARAALRIGAGLVTLGSAPDAMAENAARLDEIMLHPVPDREMLDAVLQDRRITALCLGPAFGTGPREAGLLQAALGANRPVVLDADALTLLSQDQALFAALHETCVLTPHGGEFARLFPDLAARLAEPPASGPAFSKLDAAREAAARAGAVLLLKGPDTVIAAPDGRARISSAAYGREAPWLATAGAGDVLAGLITGLLARGLRPFEAASAGAWLHVEAARAFGPGLIAGDLPDTIPKVLRALGRRVRTEQPFGPPPAGMFAQA